MISANRGSMHLIDSHVVTLLKDVTYLTKASTSTFTDTVGNHILFTIIRLLGMFELSIKEGSCRFRH